MAEVNGRIDGWWNDSTGMRFTVRCPELRFSANSDIEAVQKSIAA